MAIGLPSYHKERRNLNIPKVEAKSKAIKAFEQMGCEEIGLHPFALDYNSLGSILTSGERIYVNITESEIIIRSECIFITRIFDFGKNKANVNEFWEAYDSIIL